MLTENGPATEKYEYEIDYNFSTSKIQFIRKTVFGWIFALDVVYICNGCGSDRPGL